ncbi:hypothetical protein [Brucella pseudogrignonensis]|uniref:hypothetical protein n=1 Tax=Brucella pseudogrignonensis TaxID=419475 RepID=UPI003D95E075
MSLKFGPTFLAKISDFFQPLFRDAVASDGEWLPYELRPTVYRKNTRVNLRTSPKPTGYFVWPEIQSVVIVFTDKNVEYNYQDRAKLSEAVCYLKENKIPKINFVRGAFKTTALITVIILLLLLISQFGARSL